MNISQKIMNKLFATLKILIIAVVLTSFLIIPSFADSDKIESSIVRVIVSFQRSDPLLPWQKNKPGVRIGYGVVIGDSLIITTESLIRNHKLVEIQKAGSGEKITATVEISDYQVDLALLKIHKDAKFTKLTPIQLAKKVPLDKPLQVVQFDNSSKVQYGSTRTLQVAMSKLSSAPYASLIFKLQSDINVEEEGIPVIYNGKLAGLVINYDQSTRVADMLAFTILDRFMTNASEAMYKGFASAGFMWSYLIDPVKRDYLQVKDKGNGILVLSCFPGTGASEVLKPNDVIMEWDSYSIDNRGFYKDPVFGQLNISYLIKGKRKPGDIIPVIIVRDHVKRTVKLRLSHLQDSDALIPENVEGEQVEYLISGGLIIRELTGEYIRAHGSLWKRSVDPRIVNLYLMRKHDPENKGDRVVILSGVLPDLINIGYQHFTDQVITHLNGKPVNNMSDVFKIIDNDGRLRRVRLQSIDVDIVLDQNILDESNYRLAKLYRLPRLFYRKVKKGK